MAVPGHFWCLSLLMYICIYSSKDLGSYRRNDLIWNHTVLMLSMSHTWGDKEGSILFTKWRGKEGTQAPTVIHHSEGRSQMIWMMLQENFRKMKSRPCHLQMKQCQNPPLLWTFVKFSLLSRPFWIRISVTINQKHSNWYRIIPFYNYKGTYFYLLFYH